MQAHFAIKGSFLDLRAHFAIEGSPHLLNVAITG